MADHPLHRSSTALRLDRERQEAPQERNRLRLRRRAFHARRRQGDVRGRVAYVRTRTGCGAQAHRRTRPLHRRGRNSSRCGRGDRGADTWIAGAAPRRRRAACGGAAGFRFALRRDAGGRVSAHADSHDPGPVSFGAAFAYWLKLGFISFGGPAGQIAIMHEELVQRRRWISEQRFLHALNYCMVLPGPEAQQLATYIGWLMHGVRGGIVAGALFVLPSVFILIALSWIYMAFGQVSAVAGVLYGIKPAVTAIVLFAAYRIGSRALKNIWLWAIAAASFIAIFALQLPFPAIVLGAALIGVVGSKFAPGKFRTGGNHS